MLSTQYPNFPRITNQVARELEQRECKHKLVGAVRRVAYLAAQQAYREPRLHTRCCLVRLVVAADQALRQLANPPESR